MAGGVVVTSEHTALRLADFGVPAERIRVVRPGVDSASHGMRTAATSRVHPVVLLCVASLTRRKGQDVLLRALARLRASAGDCCWWGRNATRRTPASSAARRAIWASQGRIVFAGAVGAARLARLYRLADLFVLPSYYEGYGIAVAEAAARGLPVVASDAGAIPEAIVGARHRLVPPGDVAALADALRGFLVARRAIGGDWRAPTDARPRSWAAAGREFLAALDGLHAP